MSFNLIPNEEAETTVLVETLAKDAVLVANNFDAEIVEKYKAMYKTYWLIGTSITTEQIQARSVRMSITELAILLKAGGFVQALVQMGVPLESKYYSPPRAYEIVNVVFQDGHSVTSIATFTELYLLMQSHGLLIAGKLILGELIGEWATSNS